MHRGPGFRLSSVNNRRVYRIRVRWRSREWRFRKAIVTASALFAACYVNCATLGIQLKPTVLYRSFIRDSERHAAAYNPPCAYRGNIALQSRALPATSRYTRERSRVDFICYGVCSAIMWVLRDARRLGTKTKIEMGKNKKNEREDLWFAISPGMIWLECWNSIIDWLAGARWIYTVNIHNFQISLYFRLPETRIESVRCTSWQHKIFDFGRNCCLLYIIVIYAIVYRFLLPFASDLVKLPFREIVPSPYKRSIGPVILRACAIYSSAMIFSCERSHLRRNTITLGNHCEWTSHAAGKETLQRERKRITLLLTIRSILLLFYSREVYVQVTIEFPTTETIVHRLWPIQAQDPY